MKKILAFTLALMMCISLFAACTAKEDAPDETTPKLPETTADETTADETTAELPTTEDPVRVFTLKGPTGMGMAKLIGDAKDGKAALNYTFNVAGSADEFVGQIIQGNFEVACVPTNLAAVLNSKTNGAVSVAAVNTLGVLYLMENGNTIDSISALDGKTIYSSGQGAVPEYALSYVLDSLGVKANVVYEADHDAVVAKIMKGEADIALLPEPKVTAALKNENAPEKLRVALDINSLWDVACTKNQETSKLYMGCVIVNNQWAESHEGDFNKFMEEYKQSVAICSEDVDAAAAYIEAAGIIPKAPMAKAAMKNCNIVFITGDEMQEGLEGFYKVLYSFDPKAVGGKLPEDTFYR